jgi:hypothetical protein
MSILKRKPAYGVKATFVSPNKPYQQTSEECHKQDECNNWVIFYARDAGQYVLDHVIAPQRLVVF